MAAALIRRKVKTIRRKATVALLLASLVLLALPQPAWAPRTFRALVSIAGPCATPDGLTGSFTGSALLQRFDAKEGSIVALTELSGVCTDGTTFVPMRPGVHAMQIRIEHSTCDVLDLTLDRVTVPEFTVDLTNWHVLIEAKVDTVRGALCSLSNTVRLDKDVVEITNALNRLIGAK